MSVDIERYLKVSAKIETDDLDWEAARSAGLSEDERFVLTYFSDIESQTIRYLRATGRGVPRPHMDVRSVDAAGVHVGTTTSGTFSPTLRTGIALALIDTASGVELGDTVVVDVRGRELACEVVRPPFVASHVR